MEKLDPELRNDARGGLGCSGWVTSEIRNPDITEGSLARSFPSLPANPSNNIPSSHQMASSSSSSFFGRFASHQRGRRSTQSRWESTPIDLNLAGHEVRVVMFVALILLLTSATDGP